MGNNGSKKPEREGMVWIPGSGWARDMSPARPERKIDLDLEGDAPPEESLMEVPPDSDPKALRKKTTRTAHWEWRELAFEMELEPAEKLVLVALASHANERGDSIFPSKKRIAWMTNMSVRHVRTLAGRLVKKKILLEDRVPGRATRYRLTPDLADHPARVSYAEWDWKMAEKERGTGEE